MSIVLTVAVIDDKFRDTAGVAWSVCNAPDCMAY